MTGYGDSGAPIEGAVDSQVQQGAREEVQGRQSAAEKLAEENIDAPQVVEGQVSYVAAAEFSNCDFLVQAGEPVKTAMAPGNATGIIPLVTREGDVWAKFVSGILVTDDPRVIAWCDEHTKICRRSNDPMTRGWATLKELTARKANRDQLVDSSEMDADEAFPPGMTGGLQREAAKDGSPGADLVEAAEVARKSLEE